MITRSVTVLCGGIVLADAFAYGHGSFLQAQSRQAAPPAIAARDRNPRLRHDIAPCKLEPGTESAVMAVIAPQTLQLADGRFVRLAEILVPARGLRAGDYDPSFSAVDYLRKIALGKRVEIRFGGAQRDRYGVYTGHAFLKGQNEIWLQGALVESGLARAYPQVDNNACASDLVALETSARTRRAGLWDSAQFKLLRAKETRDISNLVQTYQVVEGQIRRVTEKNNRTTLHFAGEGDKGFSVILEANVKKK